MRLQIASDLHLEFLQDLFPGERLISPAVDADILVLAGDIANGTQAIELFKGWPVPGKRSINRALSAGGKFRDACVHVNNVDICDAEQLRGIERIGGGAQA